MIGRYHPHGDQAVYDALVRLAQDFSMRYTLVDGQGNSGRLTVIHTAAMRYTEVRLDAISEHILADLDRGTVDFGPNYDNKEEEPLVLPTRFRSFWQTVPAVLLSVMATNIPPHNLAELYDALTLLVDRPTASLEELMRIVTGPDFPTAGTILGNSGIRQAYATRSRNRCYSR